MNLVCPWGAVSTQRVIKGLPKGLSSGLLGFMCRLRRMYRACVRRLKCESQMERVMLEGSASQNIGVIIEECDWFSWSSF